MSLVVPGDKTTGCASAAVGEDLTGRYVDPQYANVMHEAHVVYRKGAGRFTPKQGQVPLATSRLVQTMAGETQEALCHH